MSLWNGNLRNNPALLVGIAVAYTPQIIRILNHGTTQGLSPYFLLCNALFSNLQLSFALLDAAYAWPTDKLAVLKLVSIGQLRGFAAFGAILGLLQVALQWFCSIILVTLFSSRHFNGGSSTTSSGLHRSTNVAAIAFVHAALFLLPAIFIALPKPSPDDFGSSLFIGFTTIVNTWVGLVFVLLQFYPQYLEMRRMTGTPGSLSLLSLALQAVVILAVAIRWLLRLGPLTWGDQAAPLWYWYQWGEIPLPYIIHAVGCAFLLVAYLVTHRSSKQSGDFLIGEERPLLA